MFSLGGNFWKILAVSMALVLILGSYFASPSRAFAQGNAMHGSRPAPNALRNIPADIKGENIIILGSKCVPGSPDCMIKQCGGDLWCPYWPKFSLGLKPILPVNAKVDIPITTMVIDSNNNVRELHNSTVTITKANAVRASSVLKSAIMQSIRQSAPNAGTTDIILTSIGIPHLEGAPVPKPPTNDKSYVAPILVGVGIGLAVKALTMSACIGGGAAGWISGGSSKPIPWQKIIVDCK